jgi:DNA-binding protein WhiA
MKRDANRKNNADLANLDKAATASAEVREAIMSIKKHKDYSKLPEELRETAELRLENPSLTLEELRFIHPKPISKSGLYHRLQRIVDFSFKYK